MANGFGALYVGSSGLRGAQNGLNVVANNIANVDTKGYVREQTLYVDVDYTQFARASVSDQRVGLGVDIGDVVHTRDRFLDSAYRQEAGRHAFYDAGYEAITEVETLLQEGDGQAFSYAIADLYEAFNEFAKDPNAEEIQNLVAQKASLFLTRAKGVYDGLAKYQDNINTKIKDDLKKINELGQQIYVLNKTIQKIEGSRVETAMEARDARDYALDELSKLVDVSYDETYDGVLRVQIEGQPFVDIDLSYQIDMYRDPVTDFYQPYWSHLSDPNYNGRYPVFNFDTINTSARGDVGEVKSLLLARGDKYADYTDITNITPAQYDDGVKNSVMMNSEAELDSMIHSMVTAINDLLAPTTGFVMPKDAGDPLTKYILPADPATNTPAHLRLYNDKGKEIILSGGEKVLDSENCCVGKDGELPPHELFSRQSVERFSKCEVIDADGNRTGEYIFVYNEENPKQIDSTYSIRNIVINKEVSEYPSVLPHRHQSDTEDRMGGAIAYDMAEALYEVWESDGYTLNPNDITPCTFENFYTKFCGELANRGSVYKTTADSLRATRDQVDGRRQEIIGVNTDEELQNMIKFQNAYNASSRYMNVVSQMIEYLLSSL